MVSKSKPTKGSTKKGSSPPVAKKNATVPPKGSAKLAKGNAVVHAPSKSASKVAAKPVGKVAKPVKAPEPAKPAPKTAPKPAAKKVALKNVGKSVAAPAVKAVAQSKSSSKPASKSAKSAATSVVKTPAKSAKLATPPKSAKPSSADKVSAAKKTAARKPPQGAQKKPSAAKAAPGKSEKPKPQQKSPKAVSEAKPAKVAKPEVIEAPKAKSGKAKQDLFVGSFFQEVPVGSPAPRKNKAPQAPVAVVRKPKGEESHDELIARIEKELLTVRMVAKKAQREQLCTKCCINPVEPGYMVDRDTGYCMECALVLGLGHTREARQQNFHPSLMKSEEEEVAE